MEKEKYLTPEEISVQYNVKADTIRKWIRQGKIRAAKLGRVWRISESDLRDFIRFNKD